MAFGHIGFVFLIDNTMPMMPGLMCRIVICYSNVILRQKLAEFMHHWVLATQGLMQSHRTALGLVSAASSNLVDR